MPSCSKQPKWDNITLTNPAELLASSSLAYIGGKYLTTASSRVSQTDRRTTSVPPSARGGSSGGDKGDYFGSLFHVIIMSVTSYFDVVLCPSSSQILAISFSRKPRPAQCSLASLARVPKVTPSKNPRSANAPHSYTTTTENCVTRTAPMSAGSHPQAAV